MNPGEREDNFYIEFAGDLDTTSEDDKNAIKEEVKERCETDAGAGSVEDVGLVSGSIVAVVRWASIITIGDRAEVEQNIDAVPIVVRLTDGEVITSVQATYLPGNTYLDLVFASGYNDLFPEQSAAVSRAAFIATATTMLVTALHNASSPVLFILPGTCAVGTSTRVVSATDACKVVWPVSERCFENIDSMRDASNLPADFDTTCGDSIPASRSDLTEVCAGSVIPWVWAQCNAGSFSLRVDYLDYGMKDSLRALVGNCSVGLRFNGNVLIPSLSSSRARVCTEADVSLQDSGSEDNADASVDRNIVWILIGLIFFAALIWILVKKTKGKSDKIHPEALGAKDIELVDLEGGSHVGLAAPNPGTTCTSTGVGVDIQIRQEVTTRKTTSFPLSAPGQLHVSPTAVQVEPCAKHRISALPESLPSIQPGPQSDPDTIPTASLPHAVLSSGLSSTHPTESST